VAAKRCPEALGQLTNMEDPAAVTGLTGRLIFKALHFFAGA